MNYKNVFLSVGLLFIVPGIQAAEPQQQVNLDDIITQLKEQPAALQAFTHSLKYSDLVHWSLASKLYRSVFAKELEGRRAHKGVPKWQNVVAYGRYLLPGMSREESQRAYENINLLNSNALHANAAQGNIEWINKLVKDYHFPVNILDDDGKTALHEAAEAGKEKAIDVLMELGADPLILDREGMTVLDKVTPEIRGRICKKYPDKCQY